MNMDTKPHPRSCKLQWLSEGEEVQVKQQAGVSFSIGKYEDKILCDVVPMEASHILLGRLISLSLGDQITTTLATSVLPVSSEQNS